MTWKLCGILFRLSQKGWLAAPYQMLLPEGGFADVLGSVVFSLNWYLIDRNACMVDTPVEYSVENFDVCSYGVRLAPRRYWTLDTSYIVY